MPKRSSKKKDINETAFSVVKQATGQASLAQGEPKKILLQYLLVDLAD